MVTVLYYTDNSLEPRLMSRFQDLLKVAIGDKPFITVSQRPIDFGDFNICVGDIGKSHISIFTQILVGVEQINTPYIALVEHDCIYTPVHFNFLPERDDTFYYNINHWFVQLDNGLYSYFRRKALSMMITSTDLLHEAVEEKLAFLKLGAKIKKGKVGACEFGVAGNENSYDNYDETLVKYGKELKSYRSEKFSTSLCNLDVRHGCNFTGPRRGIDRTYIHPQWGKFEYIMRSN